MNKINLHSLLSSIDISADWVGLREVRETTTTRFVRDGKPQANAKETTHGIMVEVLADGQFGYYGTNRMDSGSISDSAKKALKQAKSAAKYAIHNFTEDARPPFTGKYCSDYKISMDAISPG